MNDNYLSSIDVFHRTILLPCEKDDDACGTKTKKTNKLLLTGELSGSDWNVEDVHGWKNALRVRVPLVCGASDIVVEVDASKRVARVRGGTFVDADVLLRLPSACRVAARGGRVAYSVDAMRAHTSYVAYKPSDGKTLSVWMPHSNSVLWEELTRALSDAVRTADDGAWTSTWADMRRLAIAELPAADDVRVDALAGSTGLPADAARAIVDREILDAFEDATIRPFGWSHGVCRATINAVMERAWHEWHICRGFRGKVLCTASSATGYDLACRMLDDLMRDGDVARDAKDAIDMIRKRGLCAATLMHGENFQALEETSDWVEVARKSATGLAFFVHRAVAERFSLAGRLPTSVGENYNNMIW